jgi:hypothetical protein
MERVMPKDPTLDDPKHWHDRAAKMRALADNTANHGTQRLLLDLADDYDQLADRATKRQARQVSS